jgi:hypothetical protein
VTQILEKDANGEDPLSQVDQPSRRKVFRIDVHNTNFTVRNPIMSGGHIVYNTVGYDKEGRFEGQRRYNDFDVLQSTLRTKWPGVFITKVPPKKALVRHHDLIIFRTIKTPSS